MSGRSAVARRVAVAVDGARSRIWPLPATGLLVALVVGIWLPIIDGRVDDELGDLLARYLFTGGPDAARSVLTTVAGAVATLTSLTFSLTVVTLQLASSQFSPRLLRTFSSDGFVHVTLALFVSTFVYALTVLRTVRSDSSGSPAFVPQMAVTLALLLALACLVGLVLFLAHLASEIRVETMLQRVHGEASATLRRVLARLDDEDADPPTALPRPPAGARPLLAPSSGFLTSLDDERLVQAAVDSGTVLLLERHLGSSLVRGTPVGWSWSLEGAELRDDAEQCLREGLAGALTTSKEQTGSQDVAYGFRQITDVAVKALSPGVNDPRTAVHALGHASALLCQVAELRLGPVGLQDDEGVVRVHRDLPGLEDLLELAVSGPRRYGAADPDVLARLYALLAELAWTAPDRAARASVRDQLSRLDATADAQDLDGADRARLAEGRGQVVTALARRRPAQPA